MKMSGSKYYYTHVYSTSGYMLIIVYFQIYNSGLFQILKLSFNNFIFPLTLTVLISDSIDKNGNKLQSYSR